MTLLLSTGLEIPPSLMVASQLTSLRMELHHARYRLWSDDDMQTCISSLRDAVDVELASRLYHKLSHLNAPRFAAHRLHLPSIVFPVTADPHELSDAESVEDWSSPVPPFTLQAPENMGIRDLTRTRCG